MKTKVKRLPRKNLPFGKYKYQVICYDNNDRRRARYNFLEAIKRNNELQDVEDDIKQYFKKQGEGRCKIESSPYILYFENWNDILTLKLCWPNIPRKIYCIELFD